VTLIARAICIEQPGICFYLESRGSESEVSRIPCVFWLPRNITLPALSAGRNKYVAKSKSDTSLIPTGARSESFGRE
jgi:hypothetical protein